MISILTAAALAGSASASLPDIKIVHSGLIERYCSALSPAKPDDAVSAEIDAMLGSFRARWAEDGPRLMATTVAVTGRPYAFRETIATLHGCRDMPSYSAPLLIAAGQFTHANAKLPASGISGLERSGGKVGVGPAGMVAPLSGFSYLLWHESSHRYINDIIDGLPGETTPLLRKYAAEDAVVLSHIHLFALERLVWTRLGRTQELEDRNARLRGRGFASAIRAVDIVAAEGAERLVEELRPH